MSKKTNKTENKQTTEINQQALHAACEAMQSVQLKIAALQDRKTITFAQDVDELETIRHQVAQVAAQFIIAAKPPVEPKPPRSITKAVARHHENQFGRLGWMRLVAKLTEEIGEFAGAVNRDIERRDGRSWREEAFQELQDVLTILHVVANRMGDDLNVISSQAGERFLERQFPNVTKADHLF
jgi:NTP pyrophosphatase (non-canonical NTP hydrolase)